MNIPATYLSQMRPIAERIAKGALMAGPDKCGFDFRHDDFIVFVQIGPIGSDDNKARRRVRITDVWHITGSRASPADRDVLQMLADELL